MNWLQPFAKALAQQHGTVQISPGTRVRCSCPISVALVPLHILNVLVPEVPFAGCSFTDGFKWKQPKGDRRESGAGAGFAACLQPLDLFLQCLYVLRSLQPALSPALQHRGVPSLARSRARRGAAPRSQAQGRRAGGWDLVELHIPPLSSSQSSSEATKGAGKLLHTPATSSGKASRVFN